MKFKIGDRVMLKAVPTNCLGIKCKSFFETYKNIELEIKKIDEVNKASSLSNGYYIYNK